MSEKIAFYGIMYKKSKKQRGISKLKTQKTEPWREKV
jgi:hypothetical protein